MKKKRKRRIKIIPLFILLILACAIGFGINYTVKTIKYHKTYEYKLIQVGYSKEETKKLEILTDETKNYILEIPYNKSILDLINEKYFMEKHFKEYLDYFESSNKSMKDVVAIINVGANNKWYTNTKKTDLSKGNLILTNKFYSLDSSYNSDNMVSVSRTYSFGYNQKLTKDTFNAFLDMWKAAKEEGLTLIINSSYRSFEEQNEVYNEYEEERGVEATDKIAARPGFSEHQTGMAIDIQTYGSTGKTFESFDEFKWLVKNAHKYGFILRYPKGKEYLTGYDYESWHFRYVGVEAATYIKENDITFDEYYAYFVEKD